MTVLYTLGAVISALWLGWRGFKLWVARDWYSGPAGDQFISDHFDGRRFFNPDAQPAHSGTRAMLRWKLNAQPAVWPASLPVVPAKPAARIDGDAMVATMIGHATVLVQTQGLNILTDPVWSRRTSPFQWIGPKRVRAPGVAFDDLPRIDIVLLSHNHYDHLDLATLKRLWARDRPRIITPLGNGRMLARHGVTVTETDWGDSVDLEFCGDSHHRPAPPAGPPDTISSWVVGPGARAGDDSAQRQENASVRVHCDRVQHWASRWGFDRDRALWAGFTVELPGSNLFFAGDCGYHPRVFVDAARHGPVRLALLPVGAYEPRWFMAFNHMNPADSVQAFADLRAETAMGIHWGVWQLTDEAIDAPREALDAALDAAGVARGRFRAGVPGDVLELKKGPPAGQA